MPKLLDDTEEQADDSVLNINNAYAAKYDKWRRAEELQKLKGKFGDVDLNSEDSDSSSEIEDDSAREDTPEKEKGFLHILSVLKSQDPRIYQKDVKFFNESEPSGSASVPETKNRKKTASPIFLKDYERKVLLERGGEYSDEEDDVKVNHRQSASPSFVEETRNLKESFKEILNDDTDGELLTKRVKTEEEEASEKQDYIVWLKGQKETVSEAIQNDLKPLKEFWSKPDLDEGERFLRDYILEKRYRDEQDNDQVPTYDEIVGDLTSFDEEEETLAKQEQFEHKYNFRFENPDAEFIKAYPRTIADSLRRKDDKRKQQREAHKKNVEEAKARVRDERKQLKTLKRKEIMDKIEKLQKTAGDKLPIKVEDIDGDFDPAEYDRLMQFFSSNYYDNPENSVDAEKPVFSESEESDGFSDYDEWQPDTSEPVDEPSLSQASFSKLNNDTHESNVQNCGTLFSKYKSKEKTDEPNYGSQLRSRRKRKRHSQLSEALNRKKPLFDPGEKTFEEYFNEYYHLDYEDIVGGVACRFKYRGVEANDFGLSTDEVLAATDQELNAWVSLKKMTQYRDFNEEKFDKNAYEKKAQNVFKKAKTLKSVFETRQPEEKADAEILKAKEESGVLENSVDEKTTQKRRRKRAKKQHQVQIENGRKNLSALSNSDKHLQEKHMKTRSTPAQPNRNTTKKQIANKIATNPLPPNSASFVAPAGNGMEPNAVSKSKRKRLRKKHQTKEDKPVTLKDTAEFIQRMPNDRLLAYGVNPKKLKSKVKYSKKFRDVVNKPT